MLTEIPQDDMYVMQCPCVHLGATLDVRFMVDFQPEEALEPQAYTWSPNKSAMHHAARNFFLIDVKEMSRSI
jgi:hypothetical protein